MKIEKDETTGTYRLYVQNGENKNYLTYNPTYQTFYSHRTENPDANCDFHFCLPEESGTNASHKATLISAQDVQHGQRLVIYQRVLGKDANNTQVMYYYAISADGTLVKVENSSDSVIPCLSRNAFKSKSSGSANRNDIILFTCNIRSLNCHMIDLYQAVLYHFLCFASGTMHNAGNHCIKSFTGNDGIYSFGLKNLCRPFINPFK